MAERHLQQGALAHLGLDGRAVAALGEAGVGLAAVATGGQISLRGEGDDKAFLAAVEGALGFALPTQPNSTASGPGGTAFWLGPSEWLLVVDGAADKVIGELEAALTDCHHALNDVTESRVAIRLSGPRARDLLAKGTSLDLHDSVFAAGACAQSTMALTDMLLHRLPGEGAASFELYVHRSFADYLWRWLEGAAAEYGAVVLAAAEAA